MATEIERKFLVVNDSWRTHASPGVMLCQGYLARGGRCSVRVRIAGEHANVNLKSATLGISRTEFEYEVPLSDARVMLDTLCHRPLIEKTRYLVTHGDHVWEIDEFAGDNAGLTVAEIELDDPHEAFDHPAWVGEEVSHDTRYYNACLAEHPYKDW